MGELSRLATDILSQYKCKNATRGFAATFSSVVLGTPPHAISTSQIARDDCDARGGLLCCRNDSRRRRLADEMLRTMQTSFVAVLSLHGAAAAASASFGTHDYRQISISADGKSILWPDGRPMRLSPSSVSAFSQCPLLFRQRHIERLYEPVTPEFVTGVLVHETLANLFALEREERRLDVAAALPRKVDSHAASTKVRRAVWPLRGGE